MSEIFPGSNINKIQKPLNDNKENSLYDIVELVGLSTNLFQKIVKIFLKT